MDDLKKIREHLAKTISSRFAIVDRFHLHPPGVSFDDSTKAYCVQLQNCGDIVIFSGIRHESGGVVFNSPDDRIPLADPDCFEKFEEWVKGLK